MTGNEKRVLMIEGRPSEHPIHRSYAKAVGANFIFIDHFLRYQGRTDNRVVVTLSWFLTALYLLFQNRYRIIFCGGPVPPLVLLRKLGLFRKRTIISLAANETLFYLKEKKYSQFTDVLYRSWYNDTIDTLLCIGDLQEQLAKETIYNNEVVIHKIFNGLPESFFDIAAAFKYNPYGKDIICIANGPSGFREYYKGLDLLIEGFAQYCQRSNEGNLIIVGTWDMEVQTKLLYLLDKSIRNRIHFIGKQHSLIPYMTGVSLSVHCSRGDSYPTSTLETLALGIPTIVSDITGTAEIIYKINPAWVIKADSKAVSDSIQSFLVLTKEEKQSWSALCRQTVNGYRHNLAVAHFRQFF